MLAEDLQKALGQAISEYYAANRPSGTLDMPEPPKVWVDGGDNIGVAYNENENVIEVISASSIQDCIKHWIACSPSTFERVLSLVPKGTEGSAILENSLKASSFWVSAKNKWSDTQINSDRVFSVVYVDGVLKSIRLRIKEKEMSWEM